VGPRAGLGGCRNLLTGIRTPDRPAHSTLLYRLRYLGPVRAETWVGDLADRAVINTPPPQKERMARWYFHLTIHVFGGLLDWNDAPHIKCTRILCLQHCHKSQYSMDILTECSSGDRLRVM
jgi:hypothetical protein